MNSMERVMTAIGHKEPDRVPLFHMLSCYGAKELGVSIKEYFSKPELVAEAQLKMRDKYSNDCFYTFFYAPIEIEAFGGEVVFVEDGPPNSGEPFIKSIEHIKNIETPQINESRQLKRVLQATESLKKSVGDEVPIIGVVMSPFSLPVMQMGFEKYLELLYFRKDEFNQLMRINEEFCVAWANAQIEAGATAICYFDPLASPAMIERKKYLETGHKVAGRTLSRIQGATATHIASGIGLHVVDDIVETGSAVLGISAQDDIQELKEKADKKICLLGNLNGIDMVNWDRIKTREEVKRLIQKAAPGGGFILSDNHGEIPWQVSEDVLLEIAETVKEYGTYPIQTV
ncbi:uroporphyrinogen decarboxylase family protein [Alkalibacter saccharofermentans]|uniref:Uroporphyrinogen decarboxylase n=1 Tax=Alkalibacter saccharofermentans DSM 14828 TaxID=1120975 RepID=A0A1M4UV24_9FIRM|nr:uroporphyrinogen decarboxylase family protein [Alkalibacter saccharofermentans]SHE60507.1 uroporphyrinogen decarboxylase [Alkalibacter saccharofermentans DSM 14828]